jgi:undecaprenyl pyrophosphate phosphatase UppP
MRFVAIRALCEWKKCRCPRPLDWFRADCVGGLSGTSRSMSTIAAGQLVGLSRSAALEFSFFLSMPTMVVATGYDLLKTLRPWQR